MDRTDYLDHMALSTAGIPINGSNLTMENPDESDSKSKVCAHTSTASCDCTGEDLVQPIKKVRTSDESELTAIVNSLRNCYRDNANAAYSKTTECNDNLCELPDTNETNCGNIRKNSGCNTDSTKCQETLNKAPISYELVRNIVKMVEIYINLDKFKKEKHQQSMTAECTDKSPTELCTICDEPTKEINCVNVTTEKPKTTQRPIETTDRLMVTTERPMETIERPKVTTERPMETTDRLIATTERPMDTTTPKKSCGLCETLEELFDFDSKPTEATEPPLQPTTEHLKKVSFNSTNREPLTQSIEPTPTPVERWKPAPEMNSVNITNDATESTPVPESKAPNTACTGPDAKQITPSVPKDDSHNNKIVPDLTNTENAVQCKFDNQNGQDKNSAITSAKLSTDNDKNVSKVKCTCSNLKRYKMN